MNYGYFFSIDDESTNTPEQIVVYNFNPDGFDGSSFIEDHTNYKDSPKYPVYLHIGPDSVRFYCHYAKRVNKEKDTWIHQNVLLLDLSTTARLDGSDRLSAIIDDIYSTHFPTWSEYNEDDLTKVENEYAKKYLTPYFMAAKNRGYASLTCFKDNGGDKSGANGNDQSYVSDALRSLLLSFMFDWEHSSVFHSSPYYEECNRFLHSNLLYDAIVKKAEYYYCKEQFDPDSKLKNARRQWLRVLTQGSNELMLHESPWFDSIDEEIDKVDCKNDDTSQRAVFDWNLSKYNTWGSVSPIRSRVQIPRILERFMPQMAAVIFTTTISTRSMFENTRDPLSVCEVFNNCGFLWVLLLIMSGLYLFYIICKTNKYSSGKNNDSRGRLINMSLIKTVVIIGMAMFYVVFSIWIIQRLTNTYSQNPIVWGSLSLFIGVFIQTFLSGGTLIKTK